MRKAIVVVAASAVFALGASVFGYASDPSLVVWQDNFDSNAAGTAPSNMTGWTGGYSGNDPKGWALVDEGGGNMVVRTNDTGQSTGYSYAWVASDMGVSAYAQQILHFQGRLEYAGTAGGNRQVQTAFQFITDSGGHIGGWRLTGTGAVPLAWAGDHPSNTTIGGGTRPDCHLGPEYVWTDQLYHDFDMHWFPATGLMEWYVDGNLVDTWTNTEDIGINAQLLQWDNNSVHPDIVRYDDIIVGSIPEPATLVLLGLLGGVLMFRRRR